jgi:hypothetical protein
MIDKEVYRRAFAARWRHLAQTAAMAIPSADLEEGLLDRPRLSYPPPCNARSCGYDDVDILALTQHLRPVRRLGGEPDSSRSPSRNTSVERPGERGNASYAGGGVRSIFHLFDSTAINKDGCRSRPTPLYLAGLYPPVTTTVDANNRRYDYRLGQPSTFNKSSTVPRAACAVATYRARRTERMKEERRLVWRVLRHWTEISHSGRFPRRDQIGPWMQGEGGANSLLIAVESPIELSHFVVVGVNLAIALCPTDTLAGVLLSQVPRVVSARHGLMIEGGATLRGAGIIYRAVLLPLSEGSVAIDHVLGAMNYRSLRAEEVRSTQVNFRRLPKPRVARNRSL